jgi:hypothetical protein
MTENFDSLSIAKELFKEAKENYLRTNDKKFLKEMQIQQKEIDKLEKKEKKNKTTKKENGPEIVKTTLVIIDNKIYEQVYNPKIATCQFVSLNKDTNSYEYCDSVLDTLRNKLFVTICEESKWIKEKYVPLPSEPEDYISFEHLINEIIKFTRKYVDIAEERLILNAYTIVLSWMMEKIHAIPYLRATGLPGGGKSRFCDTYGHIAYKPINMLIPNIANIFRLQDLYRGTIVINEDTTPQKLMKNIDGDIKNLWSLLRSGFEKGHPIPRCIGDEHDVEAFEPFGLKILCSYFASNDLAFESRCLNSEMVATEKDILIALNDEFFTEALHIRNLLLDFRLKTFDMDFSEYQNQTMGFWQGKGTCRISQCLQPLSFLIKFDEKIKDFLMTVLEQKHIEEVTNNAESFDGTVFIKYLEIAQSQIVTIRELTESLTNKYAELKPRAVASSLKRLGLKTRKTHVDNKQETVIIPDVVLVTRLSKIYILPENKVEVIAKYAKAVSTETKTIESFDVDEKEQQRLQTEYESNRKDGD